MPGSSSAFTCHGRRRPSSPPLSLDQLKSLSPPAELIALSAAESPRFAAVSNRVRKVAIGVLSPARARADRQKNASAGMSRAKEREHVNAVISLCGDGRPVAGGVNGLLYQTVRALSDPPPNRQERTRRRS